MIQKSLITTDPVATVRVTFTLPSLLVAATIYLVGDFNDWHHSAHPMQRGSDGSWFTVIDLEPDRRYQFRYLTDGIDWLNDDTADEYVPNQHGTSNFVVNTAFV